MSFDGVNAGVGLGITGLIIANQLSGLRNITQNNNHYGRLVGAYEHVKYCLETDGPNAQVQFHVQGRSNIFLALGMKETQAVPTITNADALVKIKQNMKNALAKIRGRKICAIVGTALAGLAVTAYAAVPSLRNWVNEKIGLGG